MSIKTIEEVVERTVMVCDVCLAECNHTSTPSGWSIIRGRKEQMDVCYKCDDALEHIFGYMNELGGGYGVEQAKMFAEFIREARSDGA